jgi:4-hydroxy-2-oxoheptanedioate aldolase
MDKAAIMTNTKMIDKLRKKQPVFGTFVKINEPRLIESFGRAGFDYVILDAEHGTYNFHELENMIRAADIVNMSTVVRVPDCTEYSILHSLDVGAGGVQVPSLRDINIAKYGTQFSKYYPKGIRGMSVDQRSADYGFHRPPEYFRYANDNTLLIYQVETKEMVDQIEELCKIDLVDIIFIGPGDLSQSLGKPGQMNAPEVQDAIKYVCQVCLAHNKIVGTIVMDPSGFRKYLDMGMLYMSISTDMILFNKAIKDTAQSFEQFR